MNRVRDGEARWTVRSGCEQRIIGPTAPRWFDLETDSRAHRLKSARDRDVWLVQDSTHGAVVAKVSRSAGLLMWMKALLIGTPAKREWRVARVAFERGVDTPRPIGFGRRRGDRRNLAMESAFLTDYVAESLALDEVWRRTAHHGGTIGPRRDLTRRVAQALARMHDRGVVHRDLHPRNVLVQHAGSGEPPRVSFVDLHGAHLLKKPATARLAGMNLAQLDQHFHRVANRSDRLRFVREYLRCRASQWGGEGAPDMHELVVLTLAVKALHQRALARERDRRLRGDGRYFARLRLSREWSALMLLRDARRHVQQRRMDFEMTVDQWRPVLLRLAESVEQAMAQRRDQSPSVARVESMEMRVMGGSAAEGSSAAMPMRCVAKVLIAGSLPERIAWAVAGSPPTRQFREIHRLRHRDEQSPVALAVLERRVGGLPSLAILLTDRGEAPTCPRAANIG